MVYCKTHQFTNSKFLGLSCLLNYLHLLPLALSKEYRFSDHINTHLSLPVYLFLWKVNKNPTVWQKVSWHTWQNTKQKVLTLNGFCVPEQLTSFPWASVARMHSKVSSLAHTHTYTHFSLFCFSLTGLSVTKTAKSHISHPVFQAVFLYTL